MLTFLIKANVADDKLIERHLEMIKKVSQIEANFEVIFLARENFPNLNLLKLTASQVRDHNLVICAKNSSDNEMTELGLKIADSNDVLICTQDTNPDLIYNILEKRKEGKKIVSAKRKSNRFVQFFRGLGNLAYNLGLAMIGKARDNFSEVSVQYLDGRVVNSLNMNPGKTRELRISNTYKQLDTAVVEAEHIYQSEEKKPYKERVMFSTGWVTAIYLLAFLAMAVVYPLFNNFIYSWWIAVALVVWILFGIAFMVYFAKLLFKQRSGQPVLLSADGQPIFRIIQIVEFGDKIRFPRDLKSITAPIIKKEDVKVIKPKPVKTPPVKETQATTTGRQMLRKAIVKKGAGEKEGTKPKSSQNLKKTAVEKVGNSPKALPKKQSGTGDYKKVPEPAKKATPKTKTKN